MSEKASSPPARAAQPLSERTAFLITGAQPMSRRKQILIVAALVAVVPALYASGWLYSRLVARAPAPAQTAGPSDGFRPTAEQWSSLQVTTVDTATFRSEYVTDGNIAYDEDTTTPVISPYSGRVTKLIAKPGDVVRQGAPLLAIEAAEFAQGQNDVATARAQVTLATENEKRQRALYEAKAGARKDWLQAQADLAAARNALLAARNRLRILGKTDAEIDALETGGAEPRRTAETVVLAPIAGTVTQRQVGLGQYVSAGAPVPLYSIGNLATVWLIANVREAQAAQVKVGLPVSVRVLAYPDRTFDATVSWVAPAVDPSTHRIPVRAEIDNREGLLKPMMFASVSIREGGDSSAPAVPRHAVVYEGDEARVYVVRSDGSVALKRIRTGRSNGDMIEVVDGVAAGDKIVSGGTLFIDRAADAGS